MKHSASLERVKTTVVAAFVLAAVLVVPSLASTEILVSQAPLSGGGVSRWSQLWQDPSGNNSDTDAICWEDFTLSTFAEINHIEWWGTGTSEFGFQIEFWRQDPNTIAYQPLAVRENPGPPPVTPEARFTVTPSDLITSNEPGGLTHFVLDLGAPVALGANDAANPRWFIGIIGLTAQPVDIWNWAQGVGGSSLTYQFLRADGRSYHSLPESRALVLRGIVPPRLTIAMLGPDQMVIGWETNDVAYVLEAASHLLTASWAPVTNSVAIIGRQFSVNVETVESSRFFHLRKN